MAVRRSRRLQAPFADRQAAGRELAKHLSRYAGQDGIVVLGLPRGGVPVAYEVASVLQAPLDVLVVRKLGVPGQEELAMGAIASGGVLVLNAAIVADAGVDRRTLDAVTELETDELARREEAYRGDREPVAVSGRTAILVDDGLATGATMRAAIASVRERGARSVVVAVPVAARQTIAELRRVVDDIVCPWAPDPFVAVGVWYRDFSATTDDEVRDLLAQGAQLP